MTEILKVTGAGITGVLLKPEEPETDCWAVGCAQCFYHEGMGICKAPEGIKHPRRVIK
jgi:hypothetical protein